MHSQPPMPDRMKQFNDQHTMKKLLPPLLLLALATISLVSLGGKNPLLEKLNHDPQSILHLHTSKS
jgi:hypothetical protein